jgi:YHS domain-containing protein
VGATKEGVAFAGGDAGPECIVSGGKGTMQVSYKGKTYYVCCTGCRDEFKAEPEKYVQEFEAKKKKAK